MSVIGVVGQQETPKAQASVSPPPEKKLKKSAPVSKAKKSSGKASDSSTTDSKIAELDLKWSDRFNRLEALLLAKILQQPTFSSDFKVNPPRSPPASIPRDSEPFFQPTGHTGKDSSAEMHQSASLIPTDSLQGLHHLSVLLLTLLLTNSSLPANTTRTGTDLPLMVSVIVRLSPTDLLLSPPTPALLLCRGKGRTLFQVLVPVQIVTSLIDLRSIFMQRKVNFLRIRTVLLLNQIQHHPKNRHTGKPCMELDPTWGGLTYRHGQYYYRFG